MRTTTAPVALLGATLLAACCLTSCGERPVVADADPLTTVGNPFLPLWEHIPDGEPHVFADPDHPDRQRVYLYGSHDVLRTEYCGRDQVVWSAPVDSLNRWRYDGVILTVDRDATGQPFDSAATADVLYAPDVAMVTGADGQPTYYLYPNDQAGRRNGLIARSHRPDGPFEVCNWSTERSDSATGILRFDPAVLVDDDGRVYAYWGFLHSYAAELDPATMCTVKTGTAVVEDLVSGRDQDGVFRFFEASSIRKIADKYVFIYSRWTHAGEFGLGDTNYTLAYAYSDRPLGPFTYGGTIIDARGRDIDEQGDTIFTAVPSGNTHGSICRLDGQWYVFYHRQTGINEFARQAMVAPITVNLEPGPGGRVDISEGELTSEGFALDGLNPLERHSAGLACWLTGPHPAEHHWPENTFPGSYVAAGYGTDSNLVAPYAPENNSNDVVNNTAGSIVGFKYLNLTTTHGHDDLNLVLTLTPLGVDGEVSVMVDRPWTSQGGQLLGTIALTADMAQQPTELSVALPQLATLTGKHALYLCFTSATEGQSLCTLHNFVVR